MSRNHRTGPRQFTSKISHARRLKRKNGPSGKRRAERRLHLQPKPVEPPDGTKGGE